MDWLDLPTTVEQWTQKLASAACDLRSVVANVITASHVGYYLHPTTNAVGIYAPLATGLDSALVKSAAARATGLPPLFLSYSDLADPDGAWVKVAYSPTLRRAGELLNFFPGQYPGGIPNSPSPVAAMLTSGLVGAGLGYGGGKLIGAVLPEGYGKKLGRTGAVIGGLLGVAPGLVWGGANRLTDKSFNDPSLLDHARGEEPANYDSVLDGTNSPVPFSENPGIDSQQLRDLHDAAFRSSALLKHGGLASIELGARYKRAIEKVASTFGEAEPDYPYLPTDVNIDHLGRTLWDTGASPALAATTMAGMYAAHQMPDPRSRPGWVTGHQLASLAGSTAGDYAKGYLVGAAINATIGTPFSPPAFGLGMGKRCSQVFSLNG